MLISTATGGDRAIGPFLTMNMQGYKNSFDKLWGYANVVRYGVKNLKMSANIAEMSPLALKRTRKLLYEMEDMNFQQVPEAAVDALSSAFDSEDSQEARKAYIEKRKPVWTGR